MAWLQITGDDGSERAVALGTRTLRIGRSADCDVLLSDSVKSVSRAHAELRCEQGRYVIVDLASQNGTWISGERVKRAEVPVDAEITIGTFRLTCKRGELPGTVAMPPPGDASNEEAGWPDAVIQHVAGGRTEPAGRPSASRTPFSLTGIAVVLGIVMIAAAAWRFLGGSTGATTERAGAQTAAKTSRVTPPPVANRADVPPPEDPAAGETPRPAVVPPASVAPPRQGAAGAAPAPPPLATQPPVPRKPGESADAWRNRIAALEARYAYSKAALDRGDFGSAASGFEAILRSEPGFSDAPDLLVRARAGLRLSAIEILSAGRRLDAADDWIGALQQFERAREVDPTAPGIDAAMKHVRDKLRAAGREALDRGIEQERLPGHQAEALQEFTKALQWLPSDDPSLPVARAHAERLRLLKKE